MLKFICSKTCLSFVGAYPAHHSSRIVCSWRSFVSALIHFECNGFVYLNEMEEKSHIVPWWSKWFIIKYIYQLKFFICLSIYAARARTRTFNRKRHMIPTAHTHMYAQNKWRRMLTLLYIAVRSLFSLSCVRSDLGIDINRPWFDSMRRI